MFLNVFINVIHSLPSLSASCFLSLQSSFLIQSFKLKIVDKEIAVALMESLIQTMKGEFEQGIVLRLN